MKHRVNNFFLFTRHAIATRDDILIISIIKTMMAVKDVEYVIILDNNGIILGHNDISMIGRKFQDKNIFSSINSDNVNIRPEYKLKKTTEIYNIYKPIFMLNKRIGMLAMGLSPKAINDIAGGLNHRVLSQTIITIIFIITICLIFKKILFTGLVKSGKLNGKRLNTINKNLDSNFHINTKSHNQQEGNASELKH